VDDVQPIVANALAYLPHCDRFEDTAMVAALLRHLSFDNVAVKTEVARFGVVSILVHALTSGTKVKDPRAVATVFLALATLVLEPSNKWTMVASGGLKILLALVKPETDDFLASACLACIASLMMGSVTRHDSKQVRSIISSASPLIVFVFYSSLSQI
jgi:hypothetical protein